MGVQLFQRLEQGSRPSLCRQGDGHLDLGIVDLIARSEGIVEDDHHATGFQHAIDLAIDLLFIGVMNNGLNGVTNIHGIVGQLRDTAVVLFVDGHIPGHLVLLERDQVDADKARLRETVSEIQEIGALSAT